MKKGRKNKLVVSIEILRAWQYVEVYIIALFLGMWQIGDVSQEILSPICHPFDSLYASFAHFEILSEENARCFYAEAQMDIGAYILLLSSVMLGWLSNFIMEAEKQRSNEISVSDEQKSYDVEEEDIMDDLDIHSACEDSEGTETKMEKIPPLPAKFTDKFGWFLIRLQDEESSE